MLGINRLFSLAVDHGASAEMTAPAERVFEYLTDIRNHGPFVGGQIARSPAGPAQFGSAFTALVHGGEAGQVEAHFIVTKLVPQRRLTYALGTLDEYADTREFVVAAKPDGRTWVTYEFRMHDVAIVIQAIMLMLLPITLVLAVISTMTYRPLMSARAGRNLRLVATEIEQAAGCDRCSSIFRVGLHVENGSQISICGACAVKPEHIQECVYCGGSSESKIDF